MTFRCTKISFKAGTTTGTAGAHARHGEPENDGNRETAKRTKYVKERDQADWK
jgi:hypothetical protein